MTLPEIDAACLAGYEQLALAPLSSLELPLPQQQILEACTPGTTAQEQEQEHLYYMYGSSNKGACRDHMSLFSRERVLSRAFYS